MIQRWDIFGRHSCPDCKMMKNEIGRYVKHDGHLAELAALEAEAGRLRSAVKWALGEDDSDFEARKPGQGPYYWRTKLRKLAFPDEVIYDPQETPTQLAVDENQLYVRLRDWWKSSPRKPAHLAFTSGLERVVGTLMEEQLDEARQEIERLRAAAT